jgi:hypothetical protein
MALCHTPRRMSPRWLTGFGAASALFVAALLAPAALGGHARVSTLITVRAPSYMHMSGSDIYCTVTKEPQGPSVACFHDPGGPTSSVRKGWAIVSLDDLVGVDPPGSVTPKKYSREPSFAGLPPISGGTSKQKILELAQGDGALVSGSHMAVAVEPAAGGGNAIGVLYLDSKGHPIVGSFTVGISNKFVTIVEVTGASKSKRIFCHSVY